MGDRFLIAAGESNRAHRGAPIGALGGRAADGGHRATEPPAPGPDQTLTALHVLRPDLVDRYCTALPGARAAILARLWGALGREPLTGVSMRTRAGSELVVTLADGRRVSGDAAAAEPFAAACAVVRLDGVRYEDPERLLSALRLPGATDALARELANSVANVALARAGRDARAGGVGRAGGVDSSSDDLTTVEQTIVDGHPLHPCCRTRVGLTTKEVLAYAPEHRPIVPLALVAVPPERWLNTGTGRPPLLPVHPAQLDRVLATGLVRHTGDTVPARPLMSLRTLAPVGDPTLHVKTALDVQMTSAVRRVSAAAVRNGPVVSRLLARLTRGTATLRILGEYAAAAVLDDGEPSASLAAVWREAPRAGAGERILPFAALATAAPDGRLRVADAIDQGYAGRPAPFFADLVAVLLPPLLVMLSMGVALEAHGQNTLAVLRHGRPVRVLYRDLGGVRISPRRLAAAGVQPPPLWGGLREDAPEALATKLFAAVVSTVLAELVAVLAQRYGEPAHALWATVAEVARGAYADLPAHARADRAVLFGPTLPLKAMTAMRLADDPLVDRWAALPNPMAGLG